MKTALAIAEQMPLPTYAEKALRYGAHPQERTLAFHELFDAPIAFNPPDDQFSHMDDQRVAFRAAFIMSECLEILEKGLGLSVTLMVSGGTGDIYVTDSQDGNLTDTIKSAMADAGPTKRNLIEVVDGLGDLNVVVNGFAIELGVNMKAVDQEVYASNLTKLDEKGCPIVADGSDPKYPAGKILKGPNFLEPQLTEALAIPLY